MSLYSESRKKMNEKYGAKGTGSESRQSQTQSSGQKNSSGGSSLYRKYRDEMEKKYNPGYEISDEFISSFVRDVESYVTGADEAYKQLGYANSGTTYDAQKKTADGLRSKSYAISRYLAQNRDSYHEDDYLALKRYLTDFDKVSDQYSAQFGKAKDYYAQWDTEDDYNAYQNARKEYERKVNLDIGSADQEIRDLEKLHEEMSNFIKNDLQGMTFNPDAYDPEEVAAAKERYGQFSEQYGDLSKLEKLINEKKRYRNQAEYIQKGVSLAGAAQNEDFKNYSGYISTKSDSWFDQLGSKYGLGYQDLTYEYINNQDGIRDEIESKWAAYNTDSVSMGNQSEYAAKGYDLLTKDEVAVYNYYYAKEGRDKAQEYLDSIQETLNQRKASSIYAGMEGKTGLELIYGAEAGLDQFKTGMQNLFNGKDTYIAPSSAQMASAMVREDLADNGPKLPEWLGGASLGQAGYDAITTTANVAPSMLASVAANMIVPGSGAVVGTGLIGASAAGNAYQEALNEGYDKKSARAYSTLVGASEAGLQYLLGGIRKLGGKVTGKALSKMLDGIDNAFARVALELGGNMISEGAEEGLQEILTPLFKSWTLKADEDVNWSEVAYSTLLGALTSGVMEGPSTISRGVKTYKTTLTDKKLTKKIAKDIDPQKAASTLEEIEAEYGVFGETVRRAYKEGQDVAEFAIGFRTAYEIGRQGGSEKALQGVRYITQSQRETAYELGRTAAVQEQKWNQKSDGIAASLIGEDGSTEDVTISKIVSMNPDQMELQLADGRTVTDDQLSFSGDMEVLNKVWELGMDTESANAVLEASRGTDLAEEVLAAGIEEGFRYGRYGYDAQRLAKTQESARLPETVRSAAYKAGQAYRVQLRETATVSNAENVAAGEMTVQKKGAVHFDGDRSGLTERQKVSIQALETVAEITGAEIYVEPEESELLNGENGLYNPADEKIHISLNAGDDGKGTMLYTAAHEFTHRIRHRSEAKFQALADFLVAEYVKLGVDVDALVQEQQRRYAEKGIELSYDDAFEEMVASSMEEMFTKGKAIEKMNSLKKQDRTLWEEIKAFVRELAEKVRRVYEGLKPDSAEARYVRAMKEAAEELERLFAEGVMAEKTQKNTTREGGVKYSANANAYDYTKSFAQQLTDFQNGVFPERDTFVLGGTPTVLKNIGMASLPMTINQKHVGDALNGTYKGTQQEKLDHTFTAQELATLHEKIADPIAIIYDKRTGKANASESNVDVLVEMTVASGKQVICAVQIGGNGHVNGLRIDTNKVATVHGNSDSITRLTDAINEEQNGTVAVFYVNKVKTTKVLQSAGNPIPRGLSNLDGFIHSITDPGSPVKMRISDATESQQFKRWFGDWQNHPENASKVVNADGTPKVVYHGTNKSFNVFQSQSGEYWFSEYEDYAESMMEERGGGEIKSVYLNLRNPFRAKLSPGQFTDPTYEAPIIRQAKAAGHDGVIIENDTVDPLAEDTFYVVFRPEQIKSATDNIGTFDGKNPDIRYSARNENQQTREALERQNERLREDVEELKKLLKMQGKVTGGTVFKKTSVEAAARYLKKQFDTSGDTKELAKILGSFYEYIATDRELTWEGVKEQAQAAVDWLQEHEKFHRMEYAQEILDELRGNRIALDEQQTKEAAYLYGSYGAYQKMTRGLISSGGTISLDSMWHDLAERYPGFFDPNISSSDMPQAFLDALDRLENMEDVEYSYDWQMKDMDMIRAVYDSYWRVDALYTVADKNQKKMEELRSSHRQKMEDLRKSRDQAVRKVKESHRESKERAGERKKVSEQRKKLRRTVMELRKLMDRGTKEKNVKYGMQSMVAKSLKLADALLTEHYGYRDMLRSGVGFPLTDTEEAAFEEARKLLWDIEHVSDVKEFDSEIAAWEHMRKLDRHLSKKMAGLKDVFIRERKRMDGIEVHELLDGLVKEYSALEDAEDGAIRAAMDPAVRDYLSRLSGKMEAVKVADMTLEQLQTVTDAYGMVLGTVKNANKFFDKNLKFKRESLSRASMEEIRETAGETDWVPSVIKKIRPHLWNNLKPIYAIEKLGSKTFEKVFMGLHRAEGTYARDVEEAAKFSDRIRKKYGYGKWDMEEQHSFADSTGQEFTVTTGQLMSLYAYSRRKDAESHLEGGGFVHDSAISTREITEKDGKKKKKILKYEVNTARAHRLTKEMTEQIAGKLTEEQRRFVEEMQTYLSDVMGSKGNETSKGLYGIELFREKAYFPLKTAEQFLFEQNEVSGAVRLKNSGFTNKIQKGSTSPVILGDFMDVWAQHVHDMSMYHAFTAPIEDFNRVLQYKGRDEDGNQVSMKGVIQNAWGEEAVKYFEQLVEDLNGGARADSRESGAMKWMGKFKKGAVLASASVAVQQPTALLRAQALVDLKYFSPNPKLLKMGALWEEAKQYAPVAVLKEMGKFDTGTGRTTVDYIKGDKTVMDRVDDALGKLPEWADEWAWVQIWDAVKKETAAMRPELKMRSEAFLEAAGERFTEVIAKTQVYDSTLSRSGYMRSKSGLMAMATSFMAEPTTTINMIEQALREAKRGDVKTAARYAGAAYLSQIVNGLIVSLVYAARDDDEDETFAEKYIQAATGELVEILSLPLNSQPFIKDVFSIAQGFDVERSDLSLFGEVIDATMKLGKDLYAKEEDMDEAEREEFRQTMVADAWKLAETTAALFGIPAKNIRRDINAIINTWNTLTNGLEESKAMQLNAFLESAKDAVPALGWLPDKTKQEKLYEAIVSGDETYHNRLKATYKDKEGNFNEDAYRNAVRKALREQDSRVQEAGQAMYDADYIRTLELFDAVAADGFDIKDVTKAAEGVFDKIVEENAPEETEEKEETDYNIITAENYYRALEKGNAEAARMMKEGLIQENLDAGDLEHEAKSSVENALVSQIGSAYKDGEIDRATALKLLKNNTSRNETDVKKWDFQMDYGYSWGERDRAFRMGDISERQLINAIMDIEDADEQEARDYVRFVKLAAKYGDIEITASNAAGYYEHAEGAGIGVKVYMEYLEKTKGITNDKDAEGNSIRYSAVRKIMEKIDELPLTDDQKTALARSEGWAESTIRKYKLW